MSTLAWFSAQDEVENEFFITSTDNPTQDDIFSIKLEEYVDDDKDGVKDPTPDEDGAEYTDILPGDKLIKEPVITNTGYYDQYIRVTVTISDAQAWVAAVGANADIASIFGGYDATKWAHVWNNMAQFDENTQEITYVMYYAGILDGADTENDAESGTTNSITLFNHINIPTDITDEEAVAFGGGFTIDIKAEAVQTENVVPAGTPAADAAWTAFKTVEGNN